MIDLNDLQDLIGSSFFDGDSAIGGIVIYIAVLAAILVLSKKNLNMALILSLPITLIFTSLGVLSSDVSMLMIIVVVMGLAYRMRDVWRD